MSGAEADISSDGDTSFEDEDVPLPPSPLKEGTDEPFEVILKGGKPWGFTLKGGSETKSPLQVAFIDADGRAEQCGKLRVGDHVLQVNDLRCSSLTEAGQLIDAAFRTLALLVWRGTTEPLSGPSRSPSFLQKARELSERARQAAVQDDSALFTESKSSTTSRMKPRQRRIESFHGGRRGPSQPSSSSVTTPPASASKLGATPRGESSQYTPPTSSSDSGTKLALKGWATEYDLSSGRQPVIMSGGHVPSSRHMPLSSAKSSPNIHQDEKLSTVVPPSSRGYSPKPSSPMLAKSTPDIPDQINYENITSPTSPKSPSWYQQKFPNRSMVFDFSSSQIRRTTGSPRNSYSGGSPRNSYAGGSPRNSYAGYSSPYGQSNFPGSSVTGFSPTSVPSSIAYPTSSGMDTNSHRNSGNYTQNHKLTGANTNSYDDTPTAREHKHADRRSLPPQMLYQYRQDYQKENLKAESSKHLTSMPVTKEEDELDREISEIKPRPPSDLDLRPMYSPPAPPVRDISSLKYVTYRQNHEKFPSWPVTTANPPQNLGPPVDAQVGEKVSEKASDSDKSEKSDSQTSKSSAKSSGKSSDRPGSSIERKGSDEMKQARNQSDPGFKQKPKKHFYTTRKPPIPKEPDYENMKSEEERFNDFCKHSKPGYPPPKLDPDGHNYGDEKYNIPSPPERDVPNIDEKSLVEKIAAVISPSPSLHHSYQYHQHGSESGTPRLAKADLGTNPIPSGKQTAKVPGMYFQQAMATQSLLHQNLSQNSNKNMVDSGTSPLNSPTEEKSKYRTVSANVRTESFLSPTDKSRGLIIRQMPYYNTSTQTDDSLGNQSKSDKSANSSEVGEQPVQNQVSHSSAGSDDSVRANVRLSDTSSQSSGIGSLTYSDHSSAPMLRKLSEEFYRGKLSGTVSNEKRMSSASNYEDLKSPRSESSHYGSGLKEAESYSSVVIHPQEHAGPFGIDDFGSSPSLTSSRHDVSNLDHEHGNEHRQGAFSPNPRHSMDANQILHKATGSMSLASRSLHESRFTSESNLSSSSYSNQRNYSQSLLQLNRPSSSLADPSQSRSSTFTSDSSSSSRPKSSMEARSSGSRLSSDSSTSGLQGQRPVSRIGSDSVFVDKSSPLVADTNASASATEDKVSEERKPNVSVGRKESMKMAYGIHDENEHHYATPYGHQRNSSEVLSATAHDPNVAHGRSMSFNDYIPMNHNQSQAENPRLGLIKEEGSEVRWQEAVRKSKSLGRDVSGNYMNFDVKSDEVKPHKGSDSDKSDNEKKKENKPSGMRRTTSEQIRPHKSDKKHQKADIGRTGHTKDYSSSGESKGNKSDSDSGAPKPLTISHNKSDSELKRMQQSAVLAFVERKTKGSDSSEPHSPIQNQPTEFPLPPIDTTAPTVSPPPPPQSPLVTDITRKYNYTKAQRNESLRRTRSISSNSSRDSSDYMEMNRPSRNYQQTEWSRLRSQEFPRRPLSIGSDISGADNYGVVTPSPQPTPDEETVPKQVVMDDQKEKSEKPGQPDGPPPGNDPSAMVTSSPVYSNFAGEYPRRPPPPVPGVTGIHSPEDQPPALPPRTNRFINSRSESFLLAKQSGDTSETFKHDIGVGGSRWENGTLREDTYAQQLRRQARRFSEQHSKPTPIIPTSMQLISTKSQVQVSMTQSFKQEPTTALEAVPLQKHSSTSSLSPPPSVSHHSPHARGTSSPEPPPLPTPLKNGEVEVPAELNMTADFSPPPSEHSADHADDQTKCADDSYGSYKSRTTSSREVGRYKRTVSDTILRSHHERKPHHFQDLSGKDVAETPNKPPRKKLELQGRNSPTQRSNSPSMPGTDVQSANQKPGPQVPSFQAAEVTHVPHIQKSMAKPLQSIPVQKLASTHSPSNSSGNFVGTVVQRPTQSHPESSETEKQRTSVKDRVKNIEVFSHAPSPNKSASQRSGPRTSFSEDMKSDGKNLDSLEQLESTVKSSNSFRDRLRPVVRKVEPERTDDQSTHYPQPQSDRSHGESSRHDSRNSDSRGNSDVRVSGDSRANNSKTAGDTVDKFESTPPQIPSRTYRQVERQPDRQSEGSTSDRPPRPSSRQADPQANSASPYRRNSFQNRNPRPYDPKTTSNTNIHSPLAQNNYMYNKTGSGSETQRSPNQSVSEPVQRTAGHAVPEPQVPSRNHPHHSRKAWAVTNEHYSEKEKQPSPDPRYHGSSGSNHKSAHEPATNDDTQISSVHKRRKSDYSYSSVSSNSSSNLELTRDLGRRNSASSAHGSSPTSPNVSFSQLSPGSDNGIQSRSVSGSSYESNKDSNSNRLELRGDNASEQRSPPDQKLQSQQPTSYHRGDFKHWKNEKSQLDNQNISTRPPSDSSHGNHPTRSYSSSQSDVPKDQNKTYMKYADSEKHVSAPLVSVNHTRQPSAEELECDIKAKELAKVLQDKDKQLSEVLKSDSNKSRMQYMDGLFLKDADDSGEQRPRSASVKTEAKTEETKENKEPTSPMPSNYYVSPPKAMIELEIRKFGDTSQLTQGIADNDTLEQKKEELLERMIKKVDVLKEDKKELLTDIDENEALGRQVAGTVEKKCRSQQEKDKYRSYIDDIDKIIRLLLKLSGLLARAENTIQGLTENTNEKIRKMTYDKRDRLHKQHEDAKELKLDIDRRSEQIQGFLRQCLSDTELGDYHYFIKMKSKYTIQLQELEDKITLGNEQITALQKSIPNAS